MQNHRSAEKSSENSTLHVAAYSRVSTSEKDRWNSFITPIHYYHDFISWSDNMVLVDIYADEWITGTSVEKQNEFKRMLNDCRLGKIDRIYVKSAFVQSEALATSKRVSTMNRMRLEIGGYSKTKRPKRNALHIPCPRKWLAEPLYAFITSCAKMRTLCLKTVAKTV